MTTASDIITRAARSLGYLGRTEVLSAADANDGLIAFNSMLDSWSNEFLMSYISLERSFTLQINKQSYTMGTGGDVVITRPLDIVRAFIRDSNNLDYPLRPVNRAYWNDIGDKGITSQIPDTYFYDPQYPLGVFNIFPKPLLAYTIFFDSTQDQVDFSSLTTALSMPIGYELAYVTNLALQMMSAGFPCLLDEKGMQVLVANAQASKANVKRTNMKEVVADMDPAIVSRSNATYNIYSDNSPRG